MTIQEKIARDLRIETFSTHDTELQAKAEAIKSGGHVCKWRGSYAPPAAKGKIRFSLTIWVCVKR
jgi:hypothetical protein